MIKKYCTATCNIPPIFFKVDRRQHAILALGKAMDIGFYADLNGSNAKITRSVTYMHLILPSNIHNQTPHAEEPETLRDETVEMEQTCSSEVEANATEQLWQEEIQKFKSSLGDEVDELVARIRDGDHNLVSGISRFLTTYKKIATNSVAPLQH